ncbi:VOC family protein [Diaphorobacter ruginosibacter]|nr:VOC family protein [Diaphorobacter ruginosibacter]
MSGDMGAPAQLDHLVVMADTLEAGVSWCERTLGITPAAGGAHPLMGTHNRLINVSGAAFARAYLEIIAIDPEAQPTRAAPLRRWFDMDDDALRTEVAQNGPRLIHWVVSVPDLAHVHAEWSRLGIDRGAVLEASRPTPDGLLQWQITVRDDGRRLFDGCLPTLIQWGAQHPVQSLPASGVQLQSLHLAHPEAPRLEQALHAAHLPPGELATTMTTAHAPAPVLRATFSTPRGPVTLSNR